MSSENKLEKETSEEVMLSICEGPPAKSINEGGHCEDIPDSDYFCPKLLNEVSKRMGFPSDVRIMLAKTKYGYSAKFVPEKSA